MREHALALNAVGIGLWALNGWVFQALLPIRSEAVHGIEVSGALGLLVPVVAVIARRTVSGNHSRRLELIGFSIGTHAAALSVILVVLILGDRIWYGLF